MNRRLLPSVALTVALALLVSLPALAARSGGKGGGSGSSISLVLLDEAARTSSTPHFAHHVTFAVFTGRTAYPWVQNRCWQGGQLVYEEWHGFFAGYKLGQEFTLGPTPSWSGGDADCKAKLVDKSRGSDHTLATTSYSVAG
jgi:hypothetical protein